MSNAIIEWSAAKQAAERSTFRCIGGKRVSGQLATFATAEETAVVLDYNGPFKDLLEKVAGTSGFNYAWIAGMQMFVPGTDQGTGDDWAWISPNYPNEPEIPLDSLWNSKNMQPDDSNQSEQGEQDCMMLLLANDIQEIGWSDERCAGETFTGARYIVEYDCSEDSSMVGEPRKYRTKQALRRRNAAVFLSYPLSLDLAMQISSNGAVIGMITRVNVILFCWMHQRWTF